MKTIIDPKYEPYKKPDNKDNQEAVLLILPASWLSLLSGFLYGSYLAVSYTHLTLPTILSV